MAVIKEIRETELTALIAAYEAMKSEVTDE